MINRTKRTLHTGFLVGTTLLGWMAVVLYTLVPEPWFYQPRFRWELAACFALGAGARLLAFRVFKRARIALDSAIYVAATFAFGPVPAAWVVLVVMTGDALLRYLAGNGVVGRGEVSRWQATAYVAHAGALPALVILGLGALFAIKPLWVYEDLTLVWLVPLFSITFLWVHYFLAAGTYWLRGEISATLLRGYLVRVILAELSVVPLSLAMVLNYKWHGVWLFVLLGATALLFNWIFRRAVVAGEKLAERVQELDTVNKVSRVLSGSLERRTLLTNISIETVKLVGHASRFIIGVYDARHENVVFDFFNQEGENTGQAVIPRGAGLTGWIMENRKPLLLGRAQEQYRLYAKTDEYRDPAFQSWLGVPLVSYDEVMGVLAVESEQPDAYTPEHLRVLATIADTAAVALENARLYELATVDGLTGLFVRRYFDQRLTEEWRRSLRYGSQFSLGLFDLDNFKSLNDTYGHQAGDQILRAAAAVVRNNMRSADLAGRYGGEEFAFILPRTGGAEAVHVAERIRRDIEALEVRVGDRLVRISTSIGVASYPESGTDDVGALIARADQALYEAKRRGKNRVVAAEAMDKTDAERAEPRVGELHG